MIRMSNQCQPDVDGNSSGICWAQSQSFLKRMRVFGAAGKFLDESVSFDLSLV